MPDRSATHHRRWGHAALTLALAILLGGVMLLWAWNSLAVDLLGAPQARFKHALALEAGLVALTALPMLLWRALGRGKAPAAR
ncbi:MAG: hypothetical protein D6782_06760 [Alphaproteobacteria bacterium]|nr:MAG: hypothetical protein D6782_06760 [Alphaproteobacteria bacterium]